MKFAKILLAIAALRLGLQPVSAQIWTQTSAPSNSWRAVACSADGTKIVAAADDGIYFSTNSGATWTSNSTQMYAVAVSADGNRWAAVNGGTSYIYISTNWGTTWTTINASSTRDSFTLQFVATSADGKKLMVGCPVCSVYTSSDSGITWTVQSIAGDSVALSADGTKLFVVNGSSRAESFGIYISTNSGATWFSNSAPVFFAESIVSSADGNKLVLITGGGGIFVSTDMGATWMETTSVPAALPPQIASSADGSKLIASAGPILYFSVDSGATWTTNNNIPDGLNKKRLVTVSADGNTFIAAVYDGGIWTSQTTPAPQMDITPTSGNLLLSWVIPSTNFVLQQNSDLTTMNWTDVTNAPVLNLTNLRDEVMLPSTSGNYFYRLATQ